MGTARARSTVAVLGGGYAGVLAANRIAGRGGARVRVVLISDRIELVHRVRLHELAAGTRTRRYPLPELLRPGIERLHGRVTAVDAEARLCRVQTEAGETQLRYDQLIFAVGSAIRAAAPGAREHAMALAGPEAALAFASRIAALPEGAELAVIGAGLGGLESAAELAEAHPRLRVTLLGAELAPGWPEEVRAEARAGLEALGVKLLLGVKVAEVRATEVVITDGRRVPAAASVWCAGFGAPGLARDSGLPTDDQGRLLVDETLRVPGHPEIVGCGDAVAAPLSCVGSGITPMRMACATALPMAAHAADVVIDALAGRAPFTFHYKNTAQCVSLGRRRGVLVFIDEDDRPTGRVLTGRQGALAKELICQLVIGSLRLERWMPGLFTWAGRSGRRRLLTSGTPAGPKLLSAGGPRG